MEFATRQRLVHHSVTHRRRVAEQRDEPGREAAITAYETNEPRPPAGKSLPHVSGLIVVVFGWENTQCIAEIMADAQVKDADRVDGNTSILLGHGKTLIVGDDMEFYKRLYNKYGYQFQSG
jgi:hypothetical protein